MLTSPTVEQTFALAERAESLRFSVEHHLGGDLTELDALEAELLRLAPEHPFALNLRARRALPETMLPPPPVELRGAARALRAGAPDRALADALPLAGRGSAIASCACGDLLLLAGNPAEAEQHYRRVRVRLGDLPPVLTRLGRVAERTNRPAEAWSLTVDALVGNPLWGTARWQLRRLAEARGQLLAPLPLRVLEDDEHEQWRALRQSWRARGIEEAWRWAERLAPSNAAEFRSWAKENSEALRRFFDEGLVQDRG